MAGAQSRFAPHLLIAPYSGGHAARKGHAACPFVTALPIRRKAAIALLWCLQTVYSSTATPSRRFMVFSTALRMFS